MASGFHNPYAGSNVDAHLMNLQQTEQQNAAMRQQAFQNQQSMGLAQQQLAQQGALAQQGMQQEQMMAQQRMNRDLAMQQMAGQQASQLSAQEARQRAAADQALMSAQKALAQEAQQFQLQIKDLDYKILEAKATGNANALQALTAQRQAIRARAAAGATKIGVLRMAKDQTASQIQMLLARYQRQLKDTTSTLERAQTQVTNSRDAVITSFREFDTRRANEAAKAAGILPKYADQYEGFQYLEGEQTYSGLLGNLEKFSMRLTGGPEGAVESYRQPKSVEVIRDKVKSELALDMYESLRTMGAKVNDQATFAKGIMALLDGNSEEGLKAITDSGADPYTVNLVLREYEVGLMAPTSPVSMSALRQRHNEAQIEAPNSIKVRALEAAMVAAQMRLELLRKGALTASGSIASVDDLKNMLEEVTGLVDAGDYEGLMEKAATDPKLKGITKSMGEGRALEMELEDLIPLQGDLAEEEKTLRENFELDQALSELAGIETAREGLSRLKR